MTDWKAKWQELRLDLEQKRDELRVQAHLAKAEAKEELAELETKLDDLKARAEKAGDEAQDVYQELSKKAGIVGSELKDAVARIKSKLKEEKK